MFNNTFIFIFLSAALVVVSWFLNRKKTVVGIKKGFMMFRNIALPFINILILISVALYLLPPHLIVQYLGGRTGFMGFAIAAIIGSVRGLLTKRIITHVSVANMT